MMLPVSEIRVGVHRVQPFRPICKGQTQWLDSSRLCQQRSSRGSGLIARAETEEDASLAQVARPQAEAEHSSEGIAARLEFKPLNTSQKFWTSWNLLRARPWRRFKKGSLLVFKLGGEIGDVPAGLFNEDYSLKQLTSAIANAALDPRISGIYVSITPLAIGWGKVQELRRYLDYFKQSGKKSVAYMYTGGEKEYYLATAFSEYYCAPSASFALRGFAVSGSFLAGVFEKAGIEPQVKRLGKYKSAGDQLARKDMSEPQKEQLTALLDDIYDHFTATVANSVGKTKQEVVDMLDAGYVDVQKYADGGWLTGLKYADEIDSDLEKATDCEEGKMKKVSLKKYVKLSPRTFAGWQLGGKVIAVIRASGNITGAEPGGGLPGNGITAIDVIRQLRRCKQDKSVAAVVLRVDSPGGEATASDLMWREIKKLAEKKPVVASMGDVAASGGYYMAMGAQKIVAEPLTITGSIGVVTAKFNLEELYRRVGFSKEVISRGRYAEVLQESRGFTPEEEEWFDTGAKSAYAEFRNKAAQSRGMTNEQMEELAQGRVWSGLRAIKVGLVDKLGGVSVALELAKELAKIEPGKAVRVFEISTSKQSPLALLRGASVWTAALTEALSLVTSDGVIAHETASAQLFERLLVRLGVKASQSSKPKILAVMQDIELKGAGEL